MDNFEAQNRQRMKIGSEFRNQTKKSTEHLNDKKDIRKLEKLLRNTKKSSWKNRSLEGKTEKICARQEKGDH